MRADSPFARDEVELKSVGGAGVCVAGEKQGKGWRELLLSLRHATAYVFNHVACRTGSDTSEVTGTENRWWVVSEHVQ